MSKLNRDDFLHEAKSIADRDSCEWQKHESYKRLIDHDAAQRKLVDTHFERANNVAERAKIERKELDEANERVKVLEESWEEVVLAMPRGSTQRVVIDAHQRPYPLAFTQINAASDRLNDALKEPTNDE